MRKRAWIWLAIVGIAVIGASAWLATRTPEKPQAHNTLRIGAILPLTGPVASFGRSSQNALLLALDDVKSVEPKLSLQIDFEDSAADPKTAISAFERLRRIKGSEVFISSVSSVVLALKPAVQREKLLLFANAAHPELTRDGGHVFRYSNTVDSEAQSIEDFLPTIGSKQIFLLAINDEYGKAYVSELTRLAESSSPGFRLVGFDLYNRSTNDFRTILAKADQAQPDAYVLVGFGRTLGLLIKQLRETQFTGPYIASLGFVVTPDALESAGEAVRGGYFVNYSSLGDPRVQDLRKKYRERFGETPSPSIILDYAIVFMLANAQSSAGGSLDNLETYFRKRTSFDTPIGTLTGSTQGDIIAPVRVQKVPAEGDVDLWEGK